MAIITTSDLTKVYGRDFVAVDHLNIEIEKGEVFGLLGPNGAGKTTTIKMLTTVLKPSGGTAVIDGHDIIRDSLAVRKVIGVVPQDLTTDEDLKGIENLMMVSRFYNVPEERARETIKELVRLVDLEGAMQRYVRQYSGGMRKRLELIAGLVHSPKVLFLDEPTLGLDVQTRSQMWKHIEEVRENLGVTIILTSHYLEEVDALSDRVAIIDHGKIIASGTPAELKASLRGDVITITVSSENDVEKMLEYRGATEVKDLGGNRVRLKVQSADREMASLMNYIVSSGISVTGINVQKPSLDQVFLEYTGREMKDEEPGDFRSMMMRMRRLRR